MVFGLPLSVKLHYTEKYIGELLTMKIALYGSNKEELVKEKERLVNNFANEKTSQKVEVFCFYDEEELKKNLKHYQIILMEKEGIKEFKKCLAGEKVRRKITFSAGKELGTFYVDDIYYVEAELSKIRLVTEKEEYVIPISISETEKLLEGDGFIKTHRSYLINANHIKEIKHRLVILDNGQELPISKYRIKEVRVKYLEMVE